jgi:hypothetical protein
MASIAAEVTRRQTPVFLKRHHPPKTELSRDRNASKFKPMISRIKSKSKKLPIFLYQPKSTIPTIWKKEYTQVSNREIDPGNLLFVSI